MSLGVGQSFSSIDNSLTIGTPYGVSLCVYRPPLWGDSDRLFTEEVPRSVFGTLPALPNHGRAPKLLIGLVTGREQEQVAVRRTTEHVVHQALPFDLAAGGWGAAETMQMHLVQFCVSCYKNQQELAVRFSRCR